MTSESNTKRLVLRGVYEDNLGIPRSFSGKRARRPERAASRFKPVQQAGAIGVASLLALTGLLGFHLTQVDLEVGPGPDASEAAALGAPMPTVAAAGQADAGAERGPETGFVADSAAREALYSAAASRLRADFPSADSGPRTAFATADSGQYEAMLSRLSMPVADLFDLKVQTIVVDPGHGGNDPGAMGHDGLMEKDVALDIARRLRDKLTTGGYRVLLTRDDDSKINLKERVSFTTRQEADLFISIHVNSVPKEAGAVNYVETYYFGPHADDKTLELAEKENRDSDYAMGGFREIIARIGDTLKTEESAQLAAAIHHRLYTNLKRHNGELLDAGAKSGPFVVLLGVEVPSVLVEVSCISNDEEAARLRSPEYRDSIAAYLELGIVEYLARRAQH